MSTLAEITADIRALNTRLGWRDVTNTWGEYLALLSTEISEITGAYRVRRLAHYTSATGKPDDVGSELADTVIRLLDMYDVREIPVYDMGVELDDVTCLDMETEDFDDTFGGWVFWLQQKACALWDNPTWCGPTFLRACVTFACRWGLDLTAEIERKLVYNATRERHHGGTISDTVPC